LIYAVLHRFPNNFALFEDEETTHGVSAVWITGFSEEDDVKNTVVKGHRFRSMKPTYEDEYFSYASLHSYQVWDIQETVSDFHVSNLIGKASCMFLGKAADITKSDNSPITPLLNSKVNYKVPNPDHHFIFELLDHCIDYSNVKPIRQPTSVNFPCPLSQPQTSPTETSAPIREGKRRRPPRKLDDLRAKVAYRDHDDGYDVYDGDDE
jgi:hypothetical protein